MRLGIKRLFAVTMLAVVLTGQSSAAQAQNFFQQLFGFGAPAQPAPQSNPQQFLTPGGRPYQFQSVPRPRKADEDDDDRQSKGGRYKTVCVRMCDGYYFPISNSTTRKGFYNDQMKCNAACGEGARLFHMPAGSIEIESATSQQGQVYSLLAVAFKYRKTLVSGCTCRAEPWTEEAAAKHRAYAEAEAEKAPAVKVAEADTAAAATGATADNATSKAPAKIAKAAPSPKKTTRDVPIVRVAQQTKPAPLSGGMGLGGGGLTWPGDTPQRR